MRDCIVIGVGGFGSGALDCLARRGASVLGIEQFDVPHDRGSSHGQTRIIRQAYFEHPDYVPLCIRAYELWDDLQADCGRTLSRMCGLMLAGPEDGEAIAGARLSARRYGVPIESLSAADAAGRFPGFRIPPEFSVVFEPHAGFLHVEDCVRAHVERAERHGAELRIRETVRNWRSEGGTVTVATDRGEYTAGRLVITAGPWAKQVLADMQLPLEVVRKPLFWFPTTDPALHVDNGCPGFLFEMPEGVFYGFPSLDGRTLKAAEHSGGRTVPDPAGVDRDAHPADTEPVAHFLAACLPGVDPVPHSHSICMYTLTPDRHFIVDRHPAHPNVVIGAGFSGHGFKFTTVLGEALADLALHGRTDLPVGFLSLERPALRPES